MQPRRPGAVRLAAPRPLRAADLPDRAAGRSQPALRDRARGEDQGGARRAQAARRRSSTSAGASRPAARAACCRWPSPRTTPLRRFYVYFVDRRRRSESTSTCARAAPRPCRSRGRRRLVHPAAPHRVNHKGGQLRSDPTGGCTSGLGDGGGGGDPTATPRTGTACSARCCGSTRAPGDRLPHPALEPVRGQRGARRDLRLRPAQPVPLLVRPPDGRPGHRRRGPGRDRGDRLRAQPAGRAGSEGRLQLRLERLRGAQPLPPGARPPAHPPPVLQRSHSQGVLLDHRRLRDPRPRPRRPLRPLRLRRPVRLAPAGGAARPRPGAR